MNNLDMFRITEQTEPKFTRGSFGQVRKGNLGIFSKIIITGHLLSPDYLTPQI